MPYQATFVAGEIRNPERNIPRGLVAGVVAMMLLYTLVNASYLPALPLAALGASPRIGESTAVALLGPTGGRLVALGRMRSTTSRSRRAQILRLLSDATHGNCHLLLALRLTIQRFTAFAEVIERCGDRIVLGYRPVEAVCLQPVVLSINRAIAPQHGIEP